MLQNIFRQRRQEPEIDETLELSTMSLLGRMEAMLERETVKKIRFATIDNAPSYLR